MARNPDWSADENRQVVDAYFNMVRQHLARQDFAKQDCYRAVATGTGRSTKSVENKCQNISAVLVAHGIPPLRGLSPLKHHQESLAQAVSHYLHDHPDLLPAMEQEVTAAAAPRETFGGIDISWRTREPPTVYLRRWSHHDGLTTSRNFVQLEAANRSLGLAGEQAILKFERGRLKEAGRPDLAQAVRHISAELGDGLGYDIESYEASGERRLIQVKTTRLDITWPMMISRNEVEVSREFPGAYYLYRIFDFAERRPGLYRLRGALEETCDLDPTSFRALPRAS